MTADLGPPKEVGPVQDRATPTGATTRTDAVDASGSAAAAVALLVERGFHVFPADHPDHPECIGKHGPGSPCDGSRGKHPAVKWGVWAVAPTPQMIELQWAKHGGTANIAVAAGPSNLVILDEDAPSEVERWCVTHGITLPDTYEVTTGRGRHLYFHWDHTVQRIGNSPKAMDGFKIDVRGQGGYAIGEGSRHESGATYTTDGAPVADLPQEVAGILLAGTNNEKVDNEKIEAPRETTASADPNTERIKFHDRHDALVAYAGRLRNSGLDQTEALPVFRQRWLLCEQPDGQIPEARFHSTACPYPVAWEEAQAKLRDVFDRYAAGHKLDEDEDDGEVKHSGHLGMAIKLGKQFDGKLLYVNGIGWHRWDGKRWAPDGDGAARRAVHAVINRDRRIVKRLELPPEEEEKALKAISRYETASAISGILTEAAALHVFSVMVADIDADPFLLNVANGTLDLHTMELHRHDPGDRITKVASAAYWPEAPPGADWTRFLQKVLPDKAVRDYFQRLTGVSLPGEVSGDKQIAPILTGTGANGKTTAIEAVSFALGDYATTAAPDLLMLRNGEVHPTGVADLLGARFVSVAETEKDRRFDLALLKRLTGGDTLKARLMRQDFFHFEPSHLMVMATNHLPRIDDDTEAVWRRIRVVPFSVQIPAEDRDKALRDKLRAEADAVLGWIIAGWSDYRRRGGLDEPDAVLVATNSYQADSDAVGRFVGDECLTGGAQSSARTKDLYARWEVWAKREGAAQLSMIAFGRALDSKGFPADKSHARPRRRICLRSEEVQVDE